METAGFPTEDGHPVVDCRPLLEPAVADDDSLRQRTLAQLRAALTARGYFYCSVGSALPPELIERVYEQSRLVYSLPLELLKRKYASTEAPYRGFSDDEPSYDAAERSLCYSWDFGRDVPPLPPDDPDYEVLLLPASLRLRHGA